MRVKSLARSRHGRSNKFGLSHLRSSQLSPVFSCSLGLKVKTQGFGLYEPQLWQRGTKNCLKHIFSFFVETHLVLDSGDLGFIIQLLPGVPVGGILWSVFDLIVRSHWSSPVFTKPLQLHCMVKTGCLVKMWLLPCDQNNKSKACSCIADSWIQARGNQPSLNHLMLALGNNTISMILLECWLGLMVASYSSSFAMNVLPFRWQKKPSQTTRMSPGEFLQRLRPCTFDCFKPLPRGFVETEQSAILQLRRTISLSEGWVFSHSKQTLRS